MTQPNSTTTITDPQKTKVMKVIIFEMWSALFGT